ncbi:MAG: oligosaccharide flippase family protein [Planctomycetes bacterium]|nr:oligosaccharide flippase family protein [Planctomycetota bacterium]
MREEARHSTVLIVGTGASALLSIAYRCYAGRVLGPDDFSDFGFTVTFILFCCAALGPINGTVARFTAQFAARGEYGKILTLSRGISRRVVGIGVVGLLVGLLVAGPLANFLNLHSPALLPLAYVTILLTLWLSVARGTLRGLQRFDALNRNAVAEAASRLVIGIVVLSLLVTPAAGISAFLVAVGLVLVLARVQLSGLFRDHAPCPLDASAVKRFAVPMFAFSLAKGGLEHVDVLMVKQFLPATAAGQFVAAANLSLIIGVLVTPFATLALPLITSLEERGRRIMPTFLRICAYFLVLAAVPVLACWLEPEWILVTSFGSEYRAAAPWLGPLVLARLATYLSVLICLQFLARNDFRFIPVYLLGFAIEVGALFIWHDSAATIAWVVLASQTVCLAGMLVSLVLSRTRRTSRRL